MKYEIERLKAEDHDELLHFLNTSFGSKEGRTFDIVLPAMWRRDDAVMSRNMAIRIDGKIAANIGVYPMKTTVLGKEITVATTGNVATAQEHRGLGLMKELMEAAEEEALRLNVDVSRLGGERQRYNRYGFERGGSDYVFTMKEKNVKAFYSDFCKQNITFIRVYADSASEIKIMQNIYNKAATFHVERGDLRRFYDVVSSWKNEPYLALDKDGEPVGYLAASPDGANLDEHFALDSEKEFSMLSSWFEYRELVTLTFRSEAWCTELNKKALRYCENWTVNNSPSLYKPRNYVKFIDVMLSLKASYSIIPEGGFILGIEDYGNIELKDDSCALTEKKADITLNSLDTMRFLTGNVREVDIRCLDEKKIAYINSVLPLPLSWSPLDRL